MPNRHIARELVVQFVYQWTINPCELADLPSKAELFWTNNALSGDENKDYFLRVAVGTVRQLPSLDETLESLLENWKMSRVAKVDLCILRVAIFELRHEPPELKADAPVIIDEAVEIAKKYGSKDSSSFVNGILDKVASK